MKVPIYKAIAIKLGARDNCIASGKAEWQAKHEQSLYEIETYHLPNESGIDNGVKIEGNKKCILLRSAFHKMDENGFYDRWIDFRIIITPDLQFDFNLNIIGDFGKDQALKEYLHEVFDDSLREIIEY